MTNTTRKGISKSGTFFELARASWLLIHDKPKRPILPRAALAAAAYQNATMFLVIALAHALARSYWQTERDFVRWQQSSGVGNITCHPSPAGFEYSKLLQFGLCECTPAQLRAVVPAIAGEMRGAS